jgi:hypothetical protein
MEPMDWSAISYSNYNFFHVATKKDLLVFQEYYIAQMEVLRRNNEGIYENVANFTEFSSPVTTTNGKWTLVRIDPFSVDENNELYSPGLQLSIRGGHVLSDDTIVGWEQNSDFIVTLQFNEDLEDWIEVPGTSLSIPDSVLQLVNTIVSFSVTDKHLIFPQNGQVQIYERLANLSWNLIDSVPVNNTPGFGKVTYNDLDAFVYALQVEDGENLGVVFVYTKLGDQWVEQTFTVDSLGYRPKGKLGSSVVFLDAYNVLISAGLEGFADEGVPTEAGKVVLISRNSDGVWEPKMDLTGSSIFGYGIGVNDYDIIVPSLILQEDSFVNITFNTLPRCFYQPINVTCRDQQVEDCSDVSSADLYTINQALCGTTVTANLTSFTVVDEKQALVQFSFSRRYAEDYFCNVTVTCPTVHFNTTPVVTGPNAPSSAVNSANNCNYPSGLFLLIILALVMLLQYGV